MILCTSLLSVKSAKQPVRHYTNYIRNISKDRASKLECDKVSYKTVTAKHSSAIDKYHAAKELELIFTAQHMRKR